MLELRYTYEQYVESYGILKTPNVRRVVPSRCLSRLAVASCRLLCRAIVRRVVPSQFVLFGRRHNAMPRRHAKTARQDGTTQRAMARHDGRWHDTTAQRDGRRDGRWHTQPLPDNKTVFSTVNILLNKQSKHLPAHDDPKELSNKFSKFFVSKIRKIRDGLESNVREVGLTGNIPGDTFPSTCTHMTNFHSITEEAVMRVISKSSNASCLLGCIRNTFGTISLH